jgi:hypothetical protein
MNKAVSYIRFRKFVIALAVVALLSAVIMPSLPVIAAPVVTLVPSSGAVGTAVTLSGTVFDSYKGDSIHIFFDTREIDNSPTAVKADGTFDILFYISSNVSAGPHRVEVRADTTTTSVITSNSFSVDATNLMLDATEGPSGVSVDIAGSGFYINSTVTLYYENPDKQKIDTTTASAAGRFVHSIIIPLSPAGLHKIIASNDQGNSAEVQYKVLPQTKLSLNSAGPGDSLGVKGTGFASSSNIIIVLDSSNVATAVTDDFGSFETEFSIPDIKAFTYNIKSQDEANNNAVTSFTVTAGAKLSENTGSAGADLTIHGGGFAPGNAVTINYDSELIATTAADNNGNFSVTITVPSGKSGKHLITVSDGTTTRELLFNVETIAPAVPSPSLPANGTLTRAEVYFDWFDVTDTSVPVTYDLDVASDQNFASLVLQKKGIMSSQYTLTKSETLAADFKNAPYFWRIKAIDGAGNASEWATTWVFYISVPPVPTMALPTNDSPVEYPIRFSWQGVVSLSTPVTYDLQISKNLDFSSPLLDKTDLENPGSLITKDDNLKLKKGVTYYWRVKAIDAASNTSGWSPAGSFRFAPKSAFPGWATYTLISIGVVIAILFAFRLGRKTAFH